MIVQGIVMRKRIASGMGTSTAQEHQLWELEGAGSNPVRCATILNAIASGLARPQSAGPWKPRVSNLDKKGGDFQW